MNTNGLVGKIQRNGIMVLIAFAAGIGGQFTSNTINPPRPDPFTGQDATELKRDIRERDQTLQRQIDSMEIPPTWFMKKVERIERDLYNHLLEKEHSHDTDATRFRPSGTVQAGRQAD